MTIMFVTGITRKVLLWIVKCIIQECVIYVKCICNGCIIHPLSHVLKFSYRLVSVICLVDEHDGFVECTICFHILYLLTFYGGSGNDYDTQLHQVYSIPNCDKT